MTPLRQAREQASKTLKQVASIVNVDESHLSRVERNLDKASATLAEKLADYFGRSITEEQILYPERFMKKTRARKNGASPVPNQQ